MTAEISSIESALEDWFIDRKFRMERSAHIHSILQQNGFRGLSSTHGSTKEQIMWNDIVNGKPHIDSTLSADAQLRKADTYTEIFDGATDNDHPCRGSGMTFFRCLSNNTSANSSCDSQWSDFSKCRDSLKSEQQKILHQRLKDQAESDMRAKALFERRQSLLHPTHH